MYPQRPVQANAARSLANYQISTASVTHARSLAHPLAWRYTLKAPGYAKRAADLLIVRPRILGKDSSGVLETRKPRVYPIELGAPARDTDEFDIVIPRRYAVASVPLAISVNDGFASYRSRTKLVGRLLRHKRTFTIRKASIPARHAAKLRQLYRIIFSDERAMAVLERKGS